MQSQLPTVGNRGEEEADRSLTLDLLRLGDEGPINDYEAAPRNVHEIAISLQEFLDLAIGKVGLN